MEKFFKLKFYGTNVRTEVVAGFTTFFTMAYILIVNPNILGNTGLDKGALFLATVFASAIGTLVMGLFANVPYALAPGMGLNAFFTFVVVFGLGFTPYEALGMVFICGIINILITVTRIRKHIVKSIPLSLQHAIGGGIGLFIAFIGLNDARMLLLAPFNEYGTGYTELLAFKTAPQVLFIIGLVLCVVLMAKKVKGAMLIAIILTTLIGIPMGVVNISGASVNPTAIGDAFAALGNVFGKAVTDGLPSLFSNASRLPVVLTTIFAFSLSDTFDTIGTFIGTGRRSGIFSKEDEYALENGKGFSSRMDKALFADSIATSVGAILGTSNTTTYIESAAGIEEGGRTGLTAVVVAVLFLVSIVAAPFVGMVPAQATGPILVIVGILMASSFADINWSDFSEAVPAFFAASMMAFSYNITVGIAWAFISYTLIKIVTGKFKEVHPILLVATILFLANFVLAAI
ncbi:MAG: NCS2 family permease [Erysipelotrichaceae bacterium]|nr:NCS2 family permease [Erysipelotrichaceae bacterium]